MRFWQARQITRRTAATGLSQAAARAVDDQLAEAVGRLPWSRVLRMLDGMIVEADPELAAQREERAQTARFGRDPVVLDGVATSSTRTDCCRGPRSSCTSATPP